MKVRTSFSFEMIIDVDDSDYFPRSGVNVAALFMENLVRFKQSKIGKKMN